MKTAMEQTRPKSRPALETLENMSEESIQEKQAKEEMPTKKGTTAIMKSKYGCDEQDTHCWTNWPWDLWSILSAKAEGEAEEKMEGGQQRQGMWA